MSMIMLYRAMIGLFNRVRVKQVHFNDTNYLYIIVSNVFNFILYYIATFYLTYMIFCYQRGSIVSWWSILQDLNQIIIIQVILPIYIDLV